MAKITDLPIEILEVILTLSLQNGGISPLSQVNQRFWRAATKIRDQRFYYRYDFSKKGLMSFFNISPSNVVYIKSPIELTLFSACPKKVKMEDMTVPDLSPLYRTTTELELKKAIVKKPIDLAKMVALTHLTIRECVGKVIVLNVSPKVKITVDGQVVTRDMEKLVIIGRKS